MMGIVTASAPGKLMLFGEHAVVYDRPCIVTAVDLRVRVSVKILATDEVTIHSPTHSLPHVTDASGLLTSKLLPSHIKFVALAIKKFWGYIGETFGVHVITQSEFTESYGLGSSSAVTVATIKALSQATNRDISVEDVFKLGYKTVLEAQEGAASGFDVAAAVYGGTLYFVTGGKVIMPITIIDELPLVVGYSGVKANTVEYVRKVADRRERYPKIVDLTMDNIESIVKDAKPALEQGDYEKLGQLMNLNQGYLHALGVSTYELDFLIHAARLNGAYGAKLSGAGAGDCMIALVSSENRSKVENAIDQSGIPGAKVIRVRTGVEGVHIEN
jgi:mevalonate kinase